MAFERMYEEGVPAHLEKFGREQMDRWATMARNQVMPGSRVSFMDFWMQCHSRNSSSSPDLSAYTYHKVCANWVGSDDDEGNFIAPAFSSRSVFITGDAGDTPSRDVDQQHNSDGLVRAVESMGIDPDRLSFFFGKADQDATLDISGLSTEETDDPFGDGRCVPIEVGSSSPSTLFFHMCRHGSVGRWAYGSTQLVIMHALNWKGHTMNAA